MSKMFPFITKTWNPAIGCKHDCTYCWAKNFAEGRLKKISTKYKDGFEPRFFEDELNRKFNVIDFVFVCDMGDLFGDWVPDEWIEKVLDVIREQPKTTFLLLTKNPARYSKFDLPNNCLAGATIESDYEYPLLSIAPVQSERIEAMQELIHRKKFVCIEPMLDFDCVNFFEGLIRIPRLTHVAIGYDNYNNNLLEPALEKTLQLIEALEGAGIQVTRKTLREARQ